MPAFSNTKRIVTSEDLGVTPGQLVPFIHTFEEAGQLLNVANFYMTGPTPGNRFVSVALITDLGTTAWLMVPEVTVNVATTLFQNWWTFGENQSVFLFTNVPQRLAHELYFFPGYTLNFQAILPGVFDFQSPYWQQENL